MKFTIPQAVRDAVGRLEGAGFSSFLVGGCVRDLLRGVAPADWDIATAAKPEEVLELFPDGVYENRFGTVIVPLTQLPAAYVQPPTDELKKIEVTTLRVEERYTDMRHPDQIRFAATIEEDLARRDFTINAIALRVSDGAIIDPFGGQKDLGARTIRAVGSAGERFREDALRLMRAVRFATQLAFEIESDTRAAIAASADLINMIAAERIRDELVKIILTDHPERGMFMLQETGLLKHILPELEEGVGVTQNKHHVYTVFEHNVYSLMYAAQYGYSLAVRLASLLHDVGKVRTKRGEGPDATFYNHDIVGARMAARIMDRLRFPKALSEKVVTLVRYHLFFYDVGVVTESSVRRLLRKVGPENISELIQVRIAERKGSGVPKARPYRLRHLEFMIERVQRDPIAVTMLAVDGADVMEITGMKPGPRIGWILHALLEEVLDDPGLNTKEYLKERVATLNALSDAALEDLAERGKEKKEALESKTEEAIKAKHRVQ